MVTGILGGTSQSMSSMYVKVESRNPIPMVEQTSLWGDGQYTFFKNNPHIKKKNKSIRKLIQKNAHLTTFNLDFKASTSTI